MFSVIFLQLIENVFVMFYVYDKAFLLKTGFKKNIGILKILEF